MKAIGNVLTIGVNNIVPVDAKLPAVSIEEKTSK